MAIYPLLGTVGVTGTAAALAIARLMSGRASEINSGVFTRQLLANNGIPDVWTPHLVDAGGGAAESAIGKYQRGWGMRDTQNAGTRPHGGIDICGRQGTTIRAMRSGLVEHSGMKSGYGECLLLRHADGSTSMYAHLNDRLVEQGMLVQGGTPIARMGRTSSSGSKPARLEQQGSGSDPRCQQFRNMGVHLHFSTHGHPRTVNRATTTRPLPHSPIIGRAWNTDMEWAYGIDPLVLLAQASHRVQLAGVPFRDCIAWTRDWHLG